MFAIRQKSTGWWMPPFPGRAGGTHVEPKADAIPRIFRREQDAKAALDWWLEGKVTTRYYADGCFDGDLVFRKQAHRNAVDMEIVRVSVVVDAD